MNAQELRIGNFITSKTWKLPFFDVEPDDIWKVNDNPTHYEPIPITEEWLLKFGFEKCENEFWYEKSIFSLNLFGTISIQGRKLSEATFNTEIKHVHQLQNLFYCLCGEELTIKN